MVDVVFEEKYNSIGPRLQRIESSQVWLEKFKTRLDNQYCTIGTLVGLWLTYLSTNKKRKKQFNNT